MVKQGDIIKIDFSPTSGHEQSGYRPAVVVSNNFAISKTNVIYVAPVTNSIRNFPLHVKLDGRTKTSGEILCEQIKAVDINARPFTFVEKLPDDMLENVINRIMNCIEI